MSSSTFKYVTDPTDLATAALILEEAEALLDADTGPAQLMSAVERIDGLITFLEGKVDHPAKPKMISALRVKAQLQLKLGNQTEAVSNLYQALALLPKHGENEAEAETIFDLLYEHSPEFRGELDGCANIGAAIPRGH